MLQRDYLPYPFSDKSRVFFWVEYMEKVGTGTNKMIKRCKDLGLSESEFKTKSNNIVVISRKSMPTEEYLNNLGLSKKELIQFLKEKKKIRAGEEKELYKLEKENLKAIEDVYNSLSTRRQFKNR